MVVTFYEVKNWTLDLRTTRMLPLLKRLWVVGAVFSPFRHSTIDSTWFNPRLTLHITTHTGLFAANLDTWGPPEHSQKMPSGSNSHLRHNIKFYLRSNSAVSLKPDQSVKVPPLLHLMLGNHCPIDKLPSTTQKTVWTSTAKKMCRSLIILKM